MSDPIPTRELYVFAHARHAQAVGFTGRHCTFRGANHMTAWWPARGIDALRGLEFSRITFTEYAQRNPNYNRQELATMAEAGELLRTRLRLPPAIWMEL